jgi:hypothetical protein
VTAATDASLYTLERELFVQTVTSHATAMSAVEGVISRHLGDDVAQ